MGQPRESVQSRLEGLGADAGVEGEQRRRHGVGQVVPAPERPAPDPEAKAGEAELEPALGRLGGPGQPRRRRQTGPQGEPEPRGTRSVHHPQRPRVVGVHHRDVARLLAPEDARLCRRVVVHPVVAVEMVRGEVEDRRTVHPHRVHTLQLEAGKLEHVGAPGRLEHRPGERRPEVPAHEGVEAPGLAKRAEQRRGRALAVRSGDAQHQSSRREGPRGELDLPPDGDPVLSRADDGRKPERHARAHDHQIRPAEVHRAQCRPAPEHDASRRQRLRPQLVRGSLVPERHPGTARQQQLGCGEAAPARAQHRHRASAEVHVSAASASSAPPRRKRWRRSRSAR